MSDILTVAELVKRIHGSPPAVNHWISKCGLPIVSDNPRKVDWSVFQDWYFLYQWEERTFNACFDRRPPKQEARNTLLIVLKHNNKLYELGRIGTNHKSITAGLKEQAAEVVRQWLATEPELPSEADINLPDLGGLLKLQLWGKPSRRIRPLQPWGE